MTFQMWLDLSEKVLPHLAAVLTTLMTLWVKHYLDGQNKAKTTMDYTMDKGAAIYKVIYGLRDRYDTLRTAVYLLHNGGTYFTGDHKKKVTLQYEAPRNGVAEISDDFQDRLIKGAVFNWLNQMRGTRTGCLYIDNRAMVADTDMNALLHNYDTESSYSILIRDREGDPIAVLSMDFDRTDPLKSFDRDHILSQCAKLRSLLLSKTILTTDNKLVHA
jgi:hypothetical protein